MSTPPEKPAPLSAKDDGAILLLEEGTDSKLKGVAFIKRVGGDGDSTVSIGQIKLTSTPDKHAEAYTADIYAYNDDKFKTGRPVARIINDPVRKLTVIQRADGTGGEKKAIRYGAGDLKREDALAMASMLITHESLSNVDMAAAIKADLDQFHKGRER